jgi:hypothetical protein
MKVLGAIASVVLGVGVYVWIQLYSPFVTVPDIARDLPDGFQEGSLEFGRRVAKAYPAGISAERIAGELEADGFRVLPDMKTASFEVTKFPCQFIWRVHWEEASGAVSRVGAIYGGQCL